MSIIGTLTGKKRRGRPPIPSGPEKAPPIASRIEAVEIELAELHGKQGLAAVAWSLNHEGAAENLAGIEQRIAELDRDLARLRLAHDEAERQDRAMFAAQRAALQSTQIAACRRHLRNRDDAAMRLSVAIENAVSAYREMILSARKAQQACPIGMQWPGGSLTGDGELQRFTDREIFRLGDTDHENRVPSFPRDRRYVTEHPRNMEPLPERLRRQSEITLAALTGKTPPQPASVAMSQTSAMFETAAEPQTEAQAEPVRASVEPAHVDDPDAAAERAAIRARLRKPAAAEPESVAEPVE